MQKEFPSFFLVPQRKSGGTQRQHEAAAAVYGQAKHLRAVSCNRAAEDEQPQRQQHQAELAHHGNNELADVLARVMLNAEIRLAL